MGARMNPPGSACRRDPPPSMPKANRETARERIEEGKKKKGERRGEEIAVQ